MRSKATRSLPCTLCCAAPPSLTCRHAQHENANTTQHASRQIPRPPQNICVHEKEPGLPCGAFPSFTCLSYASSRDLMCGTIARSSLDTARWNLYRFQGSSRKLRNGPAHKRTISHKTCTQPHNPEPFNPQACMPVCMATCFYAAAMVSGSARGQKDTRPSAPCFLHAWSCVRVVARVCVCVCVCVCVALRHSQHLVGLFGELRAVRNQLIECYVHLWRLLAGQVT